MKVLVFVEIKFKEKKRKRKPMSILHGPVPRLKMWFLAEKKVKNVQKKSIQPHYSFPLKTEM